MGRARQGIKEARKEVGTYDTQVAREVTLDTIKDIFSRLGVKQLYIKSLAPNDNSKNQPYFGPDLTDLAFLPTGELIASTSTSRKGKAHKEKIKYQASVRLSWIDPKGQALSAPNAKLIFYPQYPEVRFSGFLSGSRVQLSEWMDPQKQGRSAGRWLILGVRDDKHVYAYLAVPGSAIAKALESAPLIQISKVFSIISLGTNEGGISSRDLLIAKLAEVHHMSWITSRKLNADLTVSPYTAQNGGGYTLEAVLGISPNGFAQPDYLGWEIKQFGVTDFPAKGAKPTTLMTPEPNGGIYVTEGPEKFVREFGYPDRNGKENRINFGGRHIANKAHHLTNLTLCAQGFDPVNKEIIDANGAISLIDQEHRIAASWSFAKLIEHWKTKHAQAAYIPCKKRRNQGITEYYYGKNIEFGTGADFRLFISSVLEGSVYYDPGIKLENENSDKPVLKRRSQFRIAHKDIRTIYSSFDFVDILQ